MFVSSNVFGEQLSYFVDDVNHIVNLYTCYVAHSTPYSEISRCKVFCKLVIFFIRLVNKFFATVTKCNQSRSSRKCWLY